MFKTVARPALFIAAGVLAPIGLAGCGESAQEKAVAQVCSSTKEIREQLTKVSSLTISSRAPEEIHAAAAVLNKEAEKVKKASPKLPAAPRTEVEYAQNVTQAELNPGLATLASAAKSPGGAEALIKQHEPEIKSLVAGLAARYKQADEALKCPGVGKSASSSSSAKTSVAASLDPYLVQAGEETGFSPSGAPTLASSAAEWAKGTTGEVAETRRLTEEGFRAALHESTTTSNGGGSSFVIELGTPFAAQHEVAAFLQQTVATEHPSSQFTVPTIPDSHGWAFSGSGKPVANVLLTEGLCVLLVGDQVPIGTDPKPPVIAGALKVYARTAHSNGVCTRTAASK